MPADWGCLLLVSEVRTRSTLADSPLRTRPMTVIGQSPSKSRSLEIATDAAMSPSRRKEKSRSQNDLQRAISPVSRLTFELERRESFTRRLSECDIDVRRIQWRSLLRRFVSRLYSTAMFSSQIRSPTRLHFRTRTTHSPRRRSTCNHIRHASSRMLLSSTRQPSDASRANMIALSCPLLVSSASERVTSPTTPVP